MLRNDLLHARAACKPGVTAQTIVRLAIFTLLLCLNGVASAENQYYVATSGSDRNPGTQAQPWATIQHAVNSFSLDAQGATIHVAAGTYSDLSTCNLSQYNNVNVCVSRGGASPSVRLVLQCDAQWSIPSGSGCLLRGSSSLKGIVVESNNVDVVGFDYGNQPNALAGIETFCYSINGPGPCPTGNSVHIIHNYVHDIAQTANDGSTGGIGCPGADDGGGIVGGRHNGYSLADYQVLENRVSTIGDQTQRANSTCQFTHGIYVDTQGAITQNNVVINAAANGVQIYSYPCNNTFTNNTVIGSGHNGLQIAGGDCGVLSPSYPAGIDQIANNILDYNGHYGVTIGTGNGGDCDSSDPINISNNLMYHNGLGNYNGTSSCASPVNTLIENPTATFVQFSGSENDNLHLQATSVAVGAGTTECMAGTALPCFPELTLDGLTRPSPLSLGAYDAASVGNSTRVPTDLHATVN
jgi:hypothetical protein